MPTGTQARTVDAWVKTTATDERYAVAYGTIASSQGLLLGVLSGKFVVTQIGASISSTSNINDGNWHHVAVTYDGSTYRLFVDGVQENSGSMTTATTLSGTIWIGSNSGPSVWSGSVDEVEFFNRQLSAAEIQAIYNASSAGKCKPPTIGNATLLPSSSVNSSVNLSIVSFNVSDFNNDGIELVYNWYVNGRGRTILNVPFDNRTDGNFSDFSGFGNTGAPKNGVVLNLSGGRIGAGIQLDGVNDYVDIADAPFDLEKNFSLDFKSGIIAANSKVDIGIIFNPTQVADYDLIMDVVASEKNPKAEAKGRSTSATRKFIT